jgi:hypothetical protein
VWLNLSSPSINRTLLHELGGSRFGVSSMELQIPTHSGQVFRRDAGRDSDLKPATIPN